MRLIEIIDKCFYKNGSIVSGKGQHNLVKQIEDLDNYPGKTFAEKVYLIKKGLTEIPSCPVCGKKLKYNNSLKYRTYCSNKCKSNSPEWKRNRTGMGFQSEDVQLKSRKSRLSKTGFEWAGQNPDTKRKIKETLEFKGREWRNSDESIAIATNRIESQGFRVLQTKIQDGETVYTVRCDKHDQEWEWDRRKCLRDGTQMYPICQKCHNEKTSRGEQEIQEYLETIYNGEIQRNNRKIIFPKEIDLYLPEFRLGIEYCGLYWHSDQFLGKNYHREKWELAQKNGIDLIQMFDNEWRDKKDICKSIIQNRLGLSQRLEARKCDIKEVEVQEARKFANNYHLQGFYPGVYIGLYFQGELVDLSIFCKCRFGKKYDWELTRHCIKAGYRVIGGLSREITFFRKNHVGSIVDYCDQRWFNGKGHWGFKEVGITPPDMQYTDYVTVIPRGKYQKKNMAKIPGFKFDPSLTQKENLLKNRMDYIYGVGHKIFVYE